jgi:pyruvate dehydrogenase E1 component beta subunit
MVTKCLQAAEQVAPEGIDVEVIDLRTLVPMDARCVLDSVRRTGRLVVAQEAVRRGGVASDVAALVAEQAFDALRAPIVRVAGRNTVIPFNLALERASIPQVEDVVAGIRSVIGDRAPGGA